jgi:hypothetical protein
MAWNIPFPTSILCDNQKFMTQSKYLQENTETSAEIEFHV